MIKLSLIGHVGQDAAISQYNNKSVVNFSVAHTEKFKNSQGVETQKTVWVNCSLWRDQTSIAQYITKGTLVYIEGFPEVRTWDGKDGNTNAGLQCRVMNIQLLGSKQRDEQPRQPQQNNQQQESWQPSPTGTGSDISTDDDSSDLPF